MQIFDFHCHIYPEKIAERASMATGRFYDTHEPKCKGTVSDLLSVFDAAGIGGALVQSVATTPAQVKSINEFIAHEVSAHPDRLVGFGTLHPESEDIEGDINHLLELGLKGVKLHPDIQKVKLDDARMLKMYELCEGRLPILIHTGDNRYDYSNPNRMLPILDAYKGLTVIGAHFGGWSIWEEAWRDYAGRENFFVDCSSSLYAITPEKAKELIHAYGSERVLFGTDYPLWTPESEIERFMKLDLTEEEREDILYNNAAKLFGIN